MEQNLISVIMPVYKTEESHLRKAIESVINQSYRKLEIVLVDDGSPDQCGAICDAYAGTDNRIRVIHKKNGGVSSARNCGLETVTGDYIFFVDSDDTLKGKIDEIISIEKNIRNLAAHQIVSVTEQSVIDKTGKSSQDIMNIIKYLIVQVGVGAGKDDWDTYDKLNQMIITALE